MQNFDKGDHSTSRETRFDPTRAERSKNRSTAESIVDFYEDLLGGWFKGMFGKKRTAARSGYLKPHQGAREIERRRRKIEMGSLIPDAPAGTTNVYAPARARWQKVWSGGPRGRWTNPPDFSDAKDCETWMDKAIAESISVAVGFPPAAQEAPI